MLSVKAVLRAMKLMRAVAEKEEREEGNPAPLYESTSERLVRKRHDEAVRDDFVVDRLPTGDRETRGEPSDRPNAHDALDEDANDTTKDS